MKKALFIIGTILLFAPLFQQITGIPHIKRLNGAVTLAKAPRFSWHAWFHSSFQDSAETFCNDNFGFRSPLIRINNQLEYSLFNKAKAQGVIIGKKDYLFELNYIKAYYGTDFIGSDSIARQVYKLRKIRDTLRYYHTELLPVFACGKGSFFPEFIPDSFKTKRGTTNYETYIKQCKLQHLPCIDYHAYIRSLKTTSKYPIYTKQGIHWSQNTMITIVDSLVNYISQIYGYTMPSIQVTSRKETYILQGTDFDIASGMNLIFYKSDSLLAYPEISFMNPKIVKKPKVVTIADSYWWGIFNYGIPNNCFENHKFWYYNNEIYPDNFKKQTLVANVDIKKEIENQDIIIILATDASLPKYGWGFINTVYDLYFHENTKN